MRMFVNDGFQQSPGSDVSPLPLRLLGFGVLMGWHFLVLFFPLPLVEESQLAQSLFVRQVTLNCSLSVFFLAGSYFIDKLPVSSKTDKPSLLLATVGASTLGGVGLVIAPSLGGTGAALASVVLVAAGEATLTILWLRFYSEISVGYAGRYIAASAVIGALICFFTRHLTLEISLAVFILLPALSGAMLILAESTSSFRRNEEGGAGVPDWPSARRPFLRSTAQLVLFSFVFGLIQGCVSTNSTLLPLSDPTAMLGVGAAGIGVVALYFASPAKPDLRPVHKASILVFVAGILLTPFSDGPLSNIAAVALMTGFLLYDILILVFVVDLIRTFDLRATRVLGLNRCLEYGAFGLGICLGFLIWENAGSTPLAPFALCSAAAFASIAAALFLMNEENTWYADFYTLHGKRIDDTDMPAEVIITQDRRHAACENVCSQFGLTPREREIFMLLAKGRNAEYVQNALFISNHTVKTHISNIYKKLDVHSSQELIDIIDQEEDANESEK